MSITKAVIPCGGLGTRFLPITKAVSKEILPIIDTPVLGYIVDEAVNSGITEIMIVLGKNKDDIRKYFTKNAELEDKLIAAGKQDYCDMIRRITDRAEVVFAVQEEPRGSGDAVMHARSFTGENPFVLSWGDDLIIGKPPVMKQLMDAFGTYNKTILGVQQYPIAEIGKYGVADITKSEGRAHMMRGIIEKPEPKDAPSNLAALGRYVLTAEIYDEILDTKPGKGGEIQLTDTLNAISKKHGAIAYEFVGKRYDMGDKLGAAQAAVELGMCHGEIGEAFTAYIKQLAATL